MRKLLITAICLAILSTVAVTGFCELKPLYIYSDKNAPTDNYIPSGWMGDSNDIRFNDQETQEFAAGATSIKIAYNASGSQGNKWAGIYWQSAQNNWGGRNTGLDLTGYNKLAFKAKGAKGGEVITKVKVGGITTNGVTGEPVAYPDSVDAEIGPIRLTSDWEEYYVNLVDQDLSNVNGGLAMIFNADHAEGGQTIYVDEIRFVTEEGLQKETASLSFPFYVYADSNSLDNHYVASGWMPATAAKDLRLNSNWKNYPFSGDSCIRVEYKNDSGTRWAGIYWQNPANNWGNVPNAGYDLQGATKLSFWARGAKGGEIITEFKTGGISSGEYIDSDSVSVGPIQLTKEWAKHEIDLRGKDLSYVIGGFAWATNIDVNDPEGIVFFIDEIKYEK